MEKLFAGWEAPMVQACLQGRMGRVHTLGKDCALASIGDFCFLAGEPSPELLTAADAPILVPGSAGWEALIREVLGERAVPFTRYATRREPENFRRDRLIHFTRSLPHGFSIHPIGRDILYTHGGGVGLGPVRLLCGRLGLSGAGAGICGHPGRDAGGRSLLLCRL